MADQGDVTTTITATTTVTLPAKVKTYAELNPRLKPTEFFGPIGATAVVFGTPALAYLLYYGCNEVTGCSIPPVEGWESISSRLGDWPSIAGALWDWKAAGVYLAWYAWIVLCWAVLPGDWIEGTLLRDGTRKQYKMNGEFKTWVMLTPGIWTMLLTLGITAGVIARGDSGIEAMTYLYDHWVPLTSAALAMATAQAVWVYAYSFFNGELLALQGNTGNVIYDFFMGRPLNPTFPGFPSFDIKTFNEVRPGIIGWVMLNISCACEQYVRTRTVTDSMILVLIFEGWYAADCLISEPSILTQMDITTDGFGFMLSFGDLVWVPFVYSLQARYLAFRPVVLGPVKSAAIFAVEAVGQYIFRVSNNEKAEFRNGKNPKSESRCQYSADISRPHIHEHCTRHQAADIWMVGPLTTPQLPWRLDHGLGLVSPYWLQHSHHLLLRHLLWRSSSPPPDPRRRSLQGKVWQGLGEVLREGAVPYHPVCLLDEGYEV